MIQSNSVKSLRTIIITVECAPTSRGGRTTYHLVYSVLHYCGLLCDDHWPGFRSSSQNTKWPNQEIKTKTPKRIFDGRNSSSITAPSVFIPRQADSLRPFIGLSVLPGT